jgi:AraC family transcriptional regulator
LPRWKLLRVCEFVESNLGGSIKVADLAKVATLSGSHFNRAFRKSVGVTPRVFILERRIARAQALMLSTQDSLSSIAYACGLSDQSHLTRRFSKIVGLTPSRWRRQQHSRVAEHSKANGG